MVWRAVVVRLRRYLAGHALGFDALEGKKENKERESSIVVSIHNYFCHGFDWSFVHNAGYSNSSILKSYLS